MRYKFYREHKYVSFVLNEFERLVAKIDFRNRADVEKLLEGYNAIVQLLEGHAQYEDERLHELLRKKGSVFHSEIEKDHKEHQGQFNLLQNLLTRVLQSKNEKEQIELGYQFYLSYRKFVGDNLAHLHEEETVILPELQRLYSDQELRAVEFETYRLMTVKQMIEMMEALFPHMNPTDREAFLIDIRDSEPEKFAQLGSFMKKFQIKI